MKINICIGTMFVAAAAWAFGPGSGFGGGNQPSAPGDMGGGMGGSSGSFVYDTFITSPETSGNAVSHDGVWTESVSGATSVTLDSSVTSMADGVMAGATDLVTADLSAATGLTSIPAYAFAGCTGLTTVTLPSSVTSIDDTAFYGCTALASITTSTSSGGSSSGSGSSSSTDTDTSTTTDTDTGADESAAEAIASTMGDSITVGSSTFTTPTEPWTAQKATKLYGAVYDRTTGEIVGIVELKVAKVNAKKQTTRVSGKVTWTSATRSTIKSTKVSVPSETPIYASATVKNTGALDVAVGDDGFLGVIGDDYVLAPAEVGGAWTSTGSVAVDLSDSTLLPDGTIEDLLPADEPVYATSAGKWSFDKAAKVQWKKDRTTGEYSLIVTTDDGRTNLSAMKLTYNTKTGVFKGRYKVFAIQNSRLKRFSVKVTGVVVNGAGTGVATLKKTGGTWDVTVAATK